MYLRCTQCEREAWLPRRCAPSDLPDGWQVALSGDGEHWFCSPKCAAVWYIARTLGESAGESGSQASPIAGTSSAGPLRLVK